LKYMGFGEEKGGREQYRQKPLPWEGKTRGGKTFVHNGKPNTHAGGGGYGPLFGKWGVKGAAKSLLGLQGHRGQKKNL